MQQQEDRHLATQVAVGWVLFFLIKVFAFSSAILFSIFENNGFQALLGDPGPEGAHALLYVFWIISLMPIYVFIVGGFKSTIWRWPVLFVSGAVLLLGILHSWGHWAHGERETFSSSIVDYMALGSALWLVYSSFIWVRHQASA